MSTNKSHDIIQIDDDNDHPAPVVDKSKTMFPGISSYAFPKLHSLLSRSQQQKTKNDSEKKVIQTCLPLPMMAMTNDQEIKEVSNVVRIEPSIELISFNMNQQQNETNQQSNEQFRPEYRQKDEEMENGLLLVVQENLEPLVQISQVQCQNIDVITQHQAADEQNTIECQANTEPRAELDAPVPEQAMAQSEIINAVEDISTLVAQNQQIIRPQVEQRIAQVNQNNNEATEVNQLDKLMLEVTNNPQNIFNNEDLIMLGQSRDESNEKPQEDEASKSVHEDSLIYLNEHNQKIFQQEILQQQNQVQETIEQIQPHHEAQQAEQQSISQDPEPKEVYDIAKIKEQILFILPDIGEDIHSISDNEIIDIYKEAKLQIDESLRQIKVIASNSENENKTVVIEPIQENKVAEKQVIQEQIQHIEQPQAANKQPDEKQQHHIFYALRGCDEQQLRAGMIKYFPEAKDALLSMDYQQLKDLLDEALLEIDKGISSQPEKDAVLEQQKPQAQNSPKRVNSEEEYIKNYLIEFYPELSSKIQALDIHYLKELYRGVKKCQISKEELGRKFDRLDRRQAEKPSILELCIEKYPHLSEQLRQLTEQQLDKFINDAKMGFGLEPRKKAIVEKTQPSPSQRLSALNGEANVKKTPQTNRLPDPNVSELKRPKKPSTTNYREKILRNLPHLKDNIMKLDDKEVQNLYKECLMVSKPQIAKKPVFEEPAKPIIKVPHPEKTTTYIDKQKSNKEDSVKQISNPHAQKPETFDINQNDKSKTNVYQLSGENKKRKSRTILLMHTEDLSDEEQQDSGFKMRRTTEGIQRKWNCECLQSVTVSDLLKKLSEMVEKKN